MAKVSIIVKMEMDESDLCLIAQDNDEIEEMNEDIEQFCDAHIEEIWDNCGCIEVENVDIFR